MNAEMNPFSLEQVEQWPEAVDGAVLLDEIAGVLRRFVVLPKWAAEALALWTAHTYAFELRDVSTYVGIESPEKRCGKTTLLTVLSELVNRPIVAANISSPAFFRVIQETQPTLLIDEADTFFQGNEELRGILNSGYSRKTAYVVRVCSQGNCGGRGVGVTACRRTGVSAAPERYTDKPTHWPDGESDAARAEGGGEGEGNGTRGEAVEGRTSRLARFSCWCPKAVASVGRLPEALADRCILVRMQRKTMREHCERLRKLETAEIKRRCARFVRDNAESIAKAQPEIPGSLNDRQADIWEPLLALADLAGGRWPELGRQAAVNLSASAQESNPIGSLLVDILVLFVQSKAERIFSRSLVRELNRQADRPWMELKIGKEISEWWLARQLQKYGVRPRTMRIGEEQGKGYLMEDFTEIFGRYIGWAELEELKATEGYNPAGKAQDLQ